MLNKILDSTLFRYVFSGGTAAVVNLGTTWILDQLGLYYLIVVSIAFIFSLVTSFLLQKYLTFRDRGTEGVRKQFISFTVLGFVNLLINDALVYVQIDVIHLSYLILAQAIASVIIAFYSFFLYRILFSRI